jgi:hypothetical protein
MPRLRLHARVLAHVPGIVLLALMLTSALWSTIPVLADETASLPVAGASGQSTFGTRGMSNIDTALITWIIQHSKVISSSQWQSGSTSSASSGFGGSEQLYEIHLSVVNSEVTRIHWNGI